MMMIIDTPYFYAAVVLDKNEVVVDAAPIIKYLMGKTVKEVQAYCKLRGWTAVRDA
jgi:hypothetical protein